MGEESRLGDILRRYWDSLPPRVKKLAAEEQELYVAFLALAESLRPYAVPAVIREELRAGRTRRILVLLASSGVAQMALKSSLGQFQERLSKEFGVKVDEIEVHLRPDEEVRRIRKRLTGK